MAYVQANFNCVTQEIVRPDKPVPFPDLNLPTPDPDSNDDLPDEDGPYDERERKPPDSYRDWWYHSDHLGSSTYLTDNFGRPSHYYETLPFGEMIVEHNQSSFYDNAFKFNGKELDEATGMYYYGARYYDPRISIFVNVDPLAEKFREWNPYSYTMNNPINLVDPTGMGPEDWYTNLENGNIEWFEGSEERDGYANIGPSASSVIGDTHYDLKDDGKFTNLDTGKEYFKGDKVTTDSGTEIISHGNSINKVQSYFRENKQSFLKDAQTLQDTGDDIMMFGAGLALTGLATKGVGTAAGALVYSYGNAMSNIGFGLTVTTEIMTGDYSTQKGSWDAGWTLGGEAVNYGINRMVPKKVSPNANEAVKIGFGNYFTRTKNYLEKKYEIR